MASLPRITVAIPVYGVTAAQLLRCVDSALAAIGPDDELFAVIDGPQLFSAEDLRFPRSVQVVWNSVRLGLVENWNLCLALGSGDAVHLLHSDDTIDKGFYRAVRAAFQAAPNCAIVAAASAKAFEYLEPESAIRLLASRRRPPVGSVVYNRLRCGDRLRFSTAYPYCPDEELLLRLALGSGIGSIEISLYHEARWEGQARFATWINADFVDVYWRARMEGARGVPRLEGFILNETRTAVIHVAMHLIRTNRVDLANHHLAELKRLDPAAARSPMFVVASTLASMAVGRGLVAILDRVRRHG